jgi:hypothetical protein
VPVLQRQSLRPARQASHDGARCQGRHNRPRPDQGLVEGKSERKYRTATGSEAGILVLDVDPRNKGKETLARLKKELGPLPVTVTALTRDGRARGRGRLHHS